MRTSRSRTAPRRPPIARSSPTSRRTTGRSNASPNTRHASPHASRGHTHVVDFLGVGAGDRARDLGEHPGQMVPEDLAARLRPWVACEDLRASRDREVVGCQQHHLGARRRLGPRSDGHEGGSRGGHHCPRCDRIARSGAAGDVVGRASPGRGSVDDSAGGRPRPSASVASARSADVSPTTADPASGSVITIGVLSRRPPASRGHDDRLVAGADLEQLAGLLDHDERQRDDDADRPTGRPTGSPSPGSAGGTPSSVARMIGQRPTGPSR